MEKINYKKELKSFYNASYKKVETVNVPAMNFLLIDGHGDPNVSKDYKDAVEALFSVSYALKFMMKKGTRQIDYGVLPLEGLWWADDMSKFNTDDKSNWKWRSMIMQPEYITKDLVNEALEQVKKKKDLPPLSKIKFESFKEGNAVQIMHIGPFSEEGFAVEKLHDFIKKNNYKLSGRHHEIYLSDARKASPEKWKTIIRQPFIKI